MVRSLIAAAIFSAASALAQTAPEPEECLAPLGATSAVVVSHAGKSYPLTSEACRSQFLSDPERYSQLYDALRELEREGTPLEAPSDSLVPS
jgi:YHS domain-containing protein